MIILDTNVVSEPMRPKPNRDVVKWIDGCPRAYLYLAAPVLAELHAGVEKLAPSPRRDALQRGLKKLETDIFPRRILPFDALAAQFYGMILAKRQALGMPISVIDAQIAAIASAAGFEIATRNVKDFRELGLRLVNPFEQVS